MLLLGTLLLWLRLLCPSGSQRLKIATTDDGWHSRVIQCLDRWRGGFACSSVFESGRRHRQSLHVGRDGDHEVVALFLEALLQVLLIHHGLVVRTWRGCLISVDLDYLVLICQD